MNQINCEIKPDLTLNRVYWKYSLTNNKYQSFVSLNCLHLIGVLLLVSLQFIQIYFSYKKYKAYVQKQNGLQWFKMVNIVKSLKYWVAIFSINLLSLYNIYQTEFAHKTKTVLKKNVKAEFWFGFHYHGISCAKPAPSPILFLK